ncbi:hypothetical protein ACFYU9_24720 [Streptomyces sp. NPDC004327]|uniref:8-oxoguanine DNA glycosylase OGG fold protein n=1 Tax=Streptomyces sp. NPDC004327 TaxID=3364699 RepID=UPI00369AED84
MRRQELADALDAELRKRPLPATAVHAIGVWLAGHGAPYVTGAGDHTVMYVPARWSGIEPWPDGLLRQSHAQTTEISRAQVAAIAREAVKDERWSEAFVASYVWGQGTTGYGPYRLKKILARPHLDVALAEAGTTLLNEGAVAAYRVLYGSVRGLGPAFFTKFLYFLDQAADAPAASRALILDKKVAGVVRAHATRVGLEAGLVWAPRAARWTWSGGGWTPHRYEVYVEWARAAAGQLAAAGIGWPESSPELFELALFAGGWDPAAA